MGGSLNASAALVSFSGGQDSTTVLAWALDRYERVETVGFRYGQKHFVELAQRPIIRTALARLNPDWGVRLGPDHIIDLDLIGQIAKNIVSPADYIPIAGEGFEAGTCYLGTRDVLQEWGYGCGTCAACELRAKGWKEFTAQPQ